MSTVPANARLLKMVLRALLCNCLIVAAATLALAQPVAQPPPTRIVVLGDSLVAGFPLKTPAALPAPPPRAPPTHGHPGEDIHAGVSGATTATRPRPVAPARPP